MSRTLANVLGVIGAGMVGYQRGQDTKTERERRERDDQYQQDQRERTTREQKRQDEIRTETAAAYAPTTVDAEPPKPDSMDDRDVGQPGEQQVGGYVAGGRMVDGLREGGQRFATKAEADKFAADYNTPAARALRMSDVLGAKGDAKGAAEVRAGARQERLGELQIGDAERAHLDKLFNDSLNDIQTPDQLADFVSGSSLGGALKLKAVPSADGKTFTFMRLNPDGSAAPASAPFANTPEGLMEAKAGMAKGIPIAQKLEHLYKARTNAADIALKDAHAGYYKKLAEAAITRADKAGSKSTFERMDEVDKIQFNNLNKTAQEIEQAIVKAQAEGMWQADSPNAKVLTARLAAVRLQATALIDKYAGDDATKPDPIGLRTPAPAAAATTRPMTTMEQVMADMKATGVKEADVRDGGQTVRITMPGAKPAAATAAPAASAPAQASKPGAFVPDPAMEERLQRETAEMNQAKGTRYAYSNEVTAYLKKKREAEKVALQAQGEADRADELRRAKERGKAYGI